MKALKWVAGIVLLAVTIPVLVVVGILVGVLSFNLTIDENSWTLAQVEEATGFDIVLPDAMIIHLNQNFIVRGNQISIRATDNAQNPNLASIKDFEFKGVLSLSQLFGHLPDHLDLKVGTLDIWLERDQSGQLLMPGRVAHLDTPDASFFNPISFNPISTALAQEVREGVASHPDFVAMMPLESLQIDTINLEVLSPVTRQKLHLTEFELLKPTSRSSGVFATKGNLDGIPISASFGLSSSKHLSGELSFAGMEVNVDGSIGQEFKLETHLRVDNTTSLSHFFGVNLPEGPFSLTVQTHYAWDLLTANILALKTRNSLLNGLVEWRIRGRQLSGEINASKIDVGDFMPPATETPQAVASTDGGRLVPDIHLPEFFRQKPFLAEFFKGMLKVSIHRLKYDEFLFGDIFAEVNATDEGLSILLENLAWGIDGKIKGTVEIDVGEPRFDANLKVAHLLVTTLQPLAPILSRVSGSIDSKIDLDARGASLHTLIGSLEGTLEISMQDGAVQVSDRASKILNSISPKLLKDGLLVVECLSADARFDNGVSQNMSFVLDSIALANYGNGTLDLNQETADVNSLTSLSVLGKHFALPVTVKGPWTSPKVDPDLKSLLRGRVRNPPQAPDSKKSQCHETVAASVTDKYDPMTGFSLGADKLKESAKNLEQKVKDKIRQKSGGGSVNKVKDAAKSLLGGLLGN